MSVHIEIPQDKLTAFCQHWQIQEVALFGSVLRDDFRPDSNVDLLVSFDPAAPYAV
ncbi:MAG: nucleotidyltransferase domain-containing protein [Caldilineaceae bacterium]